MSKTEINDRINDLNEARNLALRRLAAREYSSSEMLIYLKRKGVDEKLAAEVVAKLIEDRLISDERYAKIVTRYQVGRGKGPNYIRMKLRQKGVKADLGDIREMIGETSGESDLALARKVVETRYPNARTDREEGARAYQALIRRGFSFDVARAAVFSRSAEEDEK